MKLRNFLIVGLFWSVIPVGVLAESYDIVFGKWETTTTTEVTGVPEQIASMMTQAPHVETQCIQNIDFIFPEDEQTECEFEKTRVNKNKMVLKMSCSSPQGIMTGTGLIEFHGKTASSEFSFQVPETPFGKMSMKNVSNAKYIGPCD